MKLRIRLSLTQARDLLGTRSATPGGVSRTGVSIIMCVPSHQIGSSVFFNYELAILSTRSPFHPINHSAIIPPSPLILTYPSLLPNRFRRANLRPANIRREREAQRQISHSRQDYRLEAALGGLVEAEEDALERAAQAGAAEQPPEVPGPPRREARRSQGKANKSEGRVESALYCV